VCVNLACLYLESRRKSTIIFSTNLVHSSLITRAQVIQSFTILLVEFSGHGSNVSHHTRAVRNQARHVRLRIFSRRSPATRVTLLQLTAERTLNNSLRVKHS
jgi:hypothetical protein